MVFTEIPQIYRVIAVYLLVNIAQVVQFVLPVRLDISFSLTHA